MADVVASGTVGMTVTMMGAMRMWPGVRWLRGRRGVDMPLSLWESVDRVRSMTIWKSRCPVGVALENRGLVAELTGEKARTEESIRS